MTIDKEAVAVFDQKLKDERKRADDQALYFASCFLLYVEKIDKAREYVDRLLKINPLNKDGLILKGWVEVCSTLFLTQCVRKFKKVQAKKTCEIK